MDHSPMRARPTTYQSVQMRSRLEAGFAQWLDKHNVRWTYEPRAFASEKGQYLPDFRLDDFYVLGNATTTYVEIKPDFTIDVHQELIRRMPIIWESEPDAVLVLVAANGTFRQVPAGQPQLLRDFPEREYDRLDFEPLDWTGIRPRSASVGTVGIGDWTDSPWPRGYWEGRG